MKERFSREDLVKKYMKMRKIYQEIQSDLGVVKNLLEDATSKLIEVSRKIGVNTNPEFRFGYQHVKRARINETPRLKDINGKYILK